MSTKYEKPASLYRFDVNLLRFVPVHREPTIVHSQADKSNGYFSAQNPPSLRADAVVQYPHASVSQQQSNRRLLPTAANSQRVAPGLPYPAHWALSASMVEPLGCSSQEGVRSQVEKKSIPSLNQWVTAKEYFELQTAHPELVGRYCDENEPIVRSVQDGKQESIRRMRPVLKMRSKEEGHILKAELSFEQQRIFDNLCQEIGNEQTSIKRLKSGNKDPLLMISTGIAGSFGQLFIGIARDGSFRAIKCIGNQSKAQSSLSSAPSRQNSLVALLSSREGIEMSRTKRLAPNLQVETMIAPKQEPGNKYLPMRLMRGDCISLIHYYYTADNEIRSVLNRFLLRAIASQVQDIHNKKYLHSDLKLENVLFDDDGSVQIADFGLSRDLQSYAVKSTGGTFYAPEQYKNTGDELTEKVDVWSLGMSFILANRDFSAGMNYNDLWPFPNEYSQKNTPFEQYGIDHRAGKINSDATESKSLANGFYKMDPHLCTFILTRMLHPEPKQRASMQEVVDFLDGLCFGEEKIPKATADKITKENLASFMSYSDSQAKVALIKDALTKIQNIEK